MRAVALDQRLHQDEYTPETQQQVKTLPCALILSSLHLVSKDVQASRFRGVPIDASTMVSRPPRYSEAFGWLL